LGPTLNLAKNNFSGFTEVFNQRYEKPKMQQSHIALTDHTP